MSSMPTLTDRADEHRVSRVQFEAFREERERRGDSSRYELLDGELLVTPAPSFRHQHVLRRLMALLESTPLHEMAIVTAPIDLAIPGTAGDTLLQPDLLVAPFDDDALSFIHPPLLIVEVLSPSTWRRDLGAKRDAYAAAGVEHYWVMAPDTPSITVHRLASDGAYREETHLTSEEQWTATSPVRLTLCPADLVR